jgi:DNA-binding transcriptional LysR family regulator
MSVRVKWRIAAGNMSNACQLTLAGQGIGLLPEFMIKEHVISGTLLPLLTEYPVSATAVHILYSNNKTKTLAAMALVDFLISELRE